MRIDEKREASGTLYHSAGDHKCHSIFYTFLSGNDGRWCIYAGTRCNVCSKSDRIWRILPISDQYVYAFWIFTSDKQYVDAGCNGDDT